LKFILNKFEFIRKQAISLFLVLLVYKKL